MRATPLFRFALATVLLANTITAAEPSLKHLYPASSAQGSTASVTASGKFDPWPPKVWVDTEGITFKPTATAGKFDVEIAKDALPGPHLVRFFNNEGASEPRFFIVSREPELLDAEPNDSFKAPQAIASLPATLSGRLDKSGDVDSFSVTLKKGQTLVASLEAYVLASTFDGMLRIVDTDGRQLAFNHDGTAMDPFLTWEAPQDGTYIVQVMGFVYPANSDVRFTGGEGCVYRLHLTAGPFVRYTLPLAVQGGKKASLQLVGWNLDSQSAEFDASQITPETATAKLPLPATISAQPLMISTLAEGLENEPNDARDNAQAIEIPGAVTGCIKSPGDEDRFNFTAVKQRTYDLKLSGSRFGSPLDAWMKIENSEGKELARNDDAAGSRDPQLTWTAPTDGVFTVAVGDLTHRGSGDFVYRLAITEAAPSINATVPNHSIAITPGKPVELKVTLKRANGFKSKFQVIAKNLPEGVSAPDVEVPENASDVAFNINAEPGTKPVGQPFELTLRETDGGKERPVRYMLVTTSENNGVPQGYDDLVIDSTEQLWLTVLPDPPK
ncbi:PPC domain-containing protein [Verrucomicrobiota bacterium sgz303538]